MGELVSVHVIPRPHENIDEVLPLGLLEVPVGELQERLEREQAQRQGVLHQPLQSPLQGARAIGRVPAGVREGLLGRVRQLEPEPAVGQPLAQAQAFATQNGIVIMGLAFLVLDWMTPGELGEVICTPEWHGGALVSAASPPAG